MNCRTTVTVMLLLMRVLFVVLANAFAFVDVVAFVVFIADAFVLLVLLLLLLMLLLVVVLLLLLFWLL